MSDNNIRVVTHDFGDFEYDDSYWNVQNDGSVKIVPTTNTYASIAHFAKGTWAYVEDREDD